MVPGNQSDDVIVEDPLLLEETLISELQSSNNNDEISLIDFLEPNGTIAVGVNILMDQMGLLLGQEREDSSSATGNDLGINTLIRSLLYDENEEALILNTTSFLSNNGVLLETTAGTLSEVDIRIDEIRVRGLDTFFNFDPFERIGRYTVQGSFAWDYIELEIYLYVSLGPPGSDTKVEERMLISTRFETLSFSLTALAAINQNLLEKGSYKTPWDWGYPRERK